MQSAEDEPSKPAGPAGAPVSVSPEPVEVAGAASYASISTNTPEPQTGDEKSDEKSDEKDGWNDDWGDDEEW